MERVISTVITQLKAGGLAVLRGYTSTELPVLERPLCAVTLSEATYSPICADGMIVPGTTGLLAEATLLIDIYDDYRHGDSACNSAAILAASICSSLTDTFTCGKALVSGVHFSADYDCFCCNVRIPIRVLVARTE